MAEAFPLDELTPLTLPAQSADLLYVVRPTDGIDGSHNLTYSDLLQQLSPQILQGVPRMLPPRTDVAAATNANNGYMHQYTVPAGALPKDEDLLRFYMSGYVILNPNNRERINLNIAFVGSPVIPYAIYFGNPTGITQPVGWNIWGYIVRLSSTSLLCKATYLIGASVVNVQNSPVNNIGGGHVINLYTANYTTPANYFDGEILLQNTGENVSTADVFVDNEIFQDLTTIEVVNF